MLNVVRRKQEDNIILNVNYTAALDTLENQNVFYIQITTRKCVFQ